MTMKLESLPNEILLDLFSYFNSIDLLRTFHGLNTRFNLLLYKQFYSYSFQFNLVSKRHFDQICQQYLPTIANRVIALQLSDYRETPEQINLFFTYIPSFKSFTHLQSLTISNLESYQTLMKLLSECRHLTNLKRLRFYSCSFRDSLANSQWIIDKIWSLPKLTYCHIHIVIGGEQLFSIPTIKSRSLERITLFFNDLQWNQMNQLIVYTPNLKHLSTSVKFSSVHYPSTDSLFPTLTKCSLHLVDVLDIPNTNIYFPHMPNLRHLNVYIWDGLITGNQWEHMIRNYLPQLKIFRLKMEKMFFYEHNIEQQADELLNSFRTSFWMNEHKWFVRCFTINKTIHLSTRLSIPHYSDTILLNSWRSTYLDDDLKQFYNDITTISNETFFDTPISSTIRLSNIEYLCIKLPINDQIYSILSNFNRLKTLSIVSYLDTYSSQLQNLLDRIPCLQKLYINQNASLPLQKSLFKHRNTSNCELHLCYYNYYFNEDECLLLTRSSLAIQCEVLSIKVKNRKSIINLVKNMNNLRSLIVRCQDNEYEKHQTEIVTWLKEHLSSKYLIVREPDDFKHILIWI